MQSLTFFYLFPSLAFLIVGASWVINRSPGILGWIPVVSCYVACSAILILGGCQQKAHVKLTAVEMDLGSPESPREIMIGGAPESPLGQDAPALEIPGYPYDALRLRRQGDQLRLVPGSGYNATVIVRSGGRIIPLSESGPYLYHLADADQIGIRSQTAAVAWTLGKGASQLTPAAGESVARWVGQNGTDIARTAILPPFSLSLRVESSRPNELTIAKGPGFPEGTIIRIDRTELPPGKTEWRVPYTEGVTRLEVARQDHLAGTSTVGLSLGGASLRWKSTEIERPESLVHSATLSDGAIATMGGGRGDDIRVFGLPEKCFELTLNPDGNLVVKLSKSARERIENSEELHIDQPIPGSFLQYRDGLEITPESEWRLGAPMDHFGGLLRFRIENATPATPSSEPIEASGDEVSARPSSERIARLLWLGNPVTIWNLPNRKVTLPMLPKHPVGLVTRRTWFQAAYPLKRVSPFPSLVTSSLFSGLENETIDSLTLLQTDPGIAVFRNGQPVIAANAGSPLGIIEPDASIAFLQLVTTEAGPSPSLKEKGYSDITRLATRDGFAAFALQTRPSGTGSRSVVKVNFHHPEVQSIPMGEIKRGKKLAESSDRSVSFGVNEISGFSSEPYQIRFHALTPFFSKANAKVVLDRRIVAQDDYRTAEADYDSEFTIGERDRLHLQITKRSFPGKTIFWLLVGGAASTSLVLLRYRSLAWNALTYGVAFLTCSRLLFSYAAMVNAPHRFDAHAAATIAVVVVPLILLLFSALLPFFLEGRLQALIHRWKEGAPFRMLVGLAGAIFIIRLLLLALGFKESINIGFRLGFSVISVPAHIILFASGCARLFAERRRIGAFDLPLIGRFFGFAVAVLMFQFATALLVSDVGIFLYMIPQVIVVALVGCGIVAESLARFRDPAEDQTELASNSVMALILIIPLAGMIWTFSAPKVLYSVPFLSNILASDDEIATGSTELRVLQFINEEYLMNLGTDTAERIAQAHAIMENYARRGLWGEGYLQVDVIHAMRNTALNDNVSAIYIFAQFGIAGALAVVLAYTTILLSSLSPARRLEGPVGWASVLAGLTFALTSLYMMVANYGYLPFTGRNLYLLGLDSGSDLVESVGLLLFMAMGLSCADFSKKSNTLPENA